MKPLASALFLSMFMVFLGGCRHRNASPNSNTAVIDNSESCLFRTPDQISYTIDTSMRSISDMVSKAKSCTNTDGKGGLRLPPTPKCPPGANPYTCTDAGNAPTATQDDDPKSAYNDWV